MRRHMILLAALVWAALLSSVVGSGKTAASPLDSRAAPVAADVVSRPADAGPVGIGQPNGPAAPNGFARVEPAEDTFVAIGIDEPQGHLNMLVTGELNNGDFETLIRFDVPHANLGIGAQITSAKLRLFKRECVADDPGPIQLQARLVTRSWKENEVVWDRKPPSSGPLTDFDVPDPEVLGYFDVDVTEIVDGWYTGEYDNHGWIFTSRTEMLSRRCTFWSSEAGSYPLASPPLLEIEWTGGVTPTFTPTSSPTASSTPTPSITPTPSDTPTPTNTLPVTDTPTVTNTPTSAPVFLPINLKREDIYVTYTPEPSTPVPATDIPPTDEATEVPTVTVTPPIPDLTFPLSEMGGSGMNGTGSLFRLSGPSLMVDLMVFPDDSGTAHPAHIHEGSCAAQGPVTHALTSVENGMSHSTLAGIDLSDVADGAHYVNVHESAQNPGNIIACGDIPIP